MVCPGRDRLKGTVEVDDTYLGWTEKGVRGRQTQKKALIAVAAEEVGEGIGCIRMHRIADVSANCLQAFVEGEIAPRSFLHTDGLLSLAGSRNMATSIRSNSSKDARNRRRNCCPGFIAWCPCSNGGSLARIRAALAWPIWTTTLTISHSGSTGTHRAIARSYFTDLRSRPSRSTLSPMRRLSSMCGTAGRNDSGSGTTIYRDYVSRGDTTLDFLYQNSKAVPPNVTQNTNDPTTAIENRIGRHAANVIMKNKRVCENFQVD
jgi:hypothetical protein